MFAESVTIDPIVSRRINGGGAISSNTNINALHLLAMLESSSRLGTNEINYGRVKPNTRTLSKVP
jgi:hypothetical protein